MAGERPLADATHNIPHAKRSVTRAADQIGRSGLLHRAHVGHPVPVFRKLPNALATRHVPYLYQFRRK